MDFFKSVFSDDLEPSSQPNPTQNPDSKPDPQLETIENNEESVKDSNFTTNSSNSSVWSFGGLIKTIANKSESVIQTYKKDLEEFSSELKKETAVIRQVASKAVKELPVSLEVGASVAQGSLESVGQAIDDLGSSVWRGTAGIITQGKDVLLSSDQDSDFIDSVGNSSNVMRDNSSRYSRFDAQVRSIQIDVNTYSEEVEDLDEFEKWKLEFVLGERDEEIDTLLSENGVMDSVYRKLVPNTISDETFWSRYFYKVYKLKQVEEARANLVKRAISGDDEDLSWDVEDEEEEGEASVSVSKGETLESSQLGEKDLEGSVVGTSDEDGKMEEKIGEEEVVVQSKSGDGEIEEVPLEGTSEISEVDDKNLIEKSEEKLVLDGKTDSCKDSDVSVVSTQPSLPEEQDLSWDEIEDLSGIDEKKVSVSDSPNRADLRKRLSAPDDEEDLSWDIEDDD